MEKEKQLCRWRAEEGYKQEPGASHLAPIRSVMFLATIYKTDGTKLDEPDFFFFLVVCSEEVALCLVEGD